MFQEINIFYGVQLDVSQNSDRIKKVRTIFEVRTIKSPYHIVCTSFMPLNRNKDKEHSRFFFRRGVLGSPSLDIGFSFSNLL